MLAVAPRPDGFVYLSRGNIGGFAYAYVGADGARLPGYGDGGDVVRVRPDGAGLERVATGFWNPFGLHMSTNGRLVATDNDPDSRGPNRLVHVVPGGDYGYRARIGGSGLHPHVAWAGELPGTLGYASATGEAPGNVLGTAGLPEVAADYLAPIWGEHTIEAFVARPRGASFVADRRVLVRGGRDFRPVALAGAPDGALFVTDWVKSAYPNHGRGRIWRIARASGDAPRPARSRDGGDDRRVWALAAESAPLSEATLRARLTDADPFVRSAAVVALSRPGRLGLRRRLVRDPSALLRLGALRAYLWAAGAELPLAAPPGLLARAVLDPDEDVRRLALVYAGANLDRRLQARLAELPSRRTAAGTPALGPATLPLYLATLSLLTEAEARHVARKAPRSTVVAKAEGQRDDVSALTERLALRRDLPDETRLALWQVLAPPIGTRLHAALEAALDGRHEALATAALWLLARQGGEAVGARILRVALDEGRPVALRKEAIAALAAFPDHLPALRPLLDEPRLALSAARALRTVPPNRDDPRVVATLGEPLGERAEDVASGRASPESLALDAGEPAEGRAVFRGPIAGCTRCHRAEGFGARVGPDLSHVGTSIDRIRILRAILAPSEDVSPEYQAYTVLRRDGELLTGTQLHLHSSSLSLQLADGAHASVPLTDVASYEAARTSLMPAGLAAALTPRELADLVAYLATRR